MMLEVGRGALALRRESECIAADRLVAARFRTPNMPAPERVNTHTSFSYLSPLTFYLLGLIQPVVTELGFFTYYGLISLVMCVIHK